MQTRESTVGACRTQFRRASTSVPQGAGSKGLAHTRPGSVDLDRDRATEPLKHSNQRKDSVHPYLRTSLSCHVGSGLDLDKIRSPRQVQMRDEGDVDKARGTGGGDSMVPSNTEEVDSTDLVMVGW